ncbi:MAG: hypothetical protein JNM34_06955 [Chthonomonadaceae bacterium]|jgi:tetratricopeptide (TPR) repeat protein|nr:hypothetical protein [Chthonomonadaceae bacterium]
MEPEEAYNRGFSLRCEGKYGEARMYLQVTLNAIPDHVNARWQMALIKGFEGDFDGSLDDLRLLAEQHPDNIDVLNDLAMTNMMLGNQDEACAEFHKILAINPDHENAQRQVRYC